MAYIGTRQRALPPPFGPAANGLILYSTEGEIRTVDPVTGAIASLVTGPETDVNPVWSLDGTRFVFERKVSGDTGTGQLYTAQADGTAVTRITPDPLLELAYGFSPDGKQVLLEANAGGTHTISLANADGSGIRALEVGMSATYASFRPPDGRQILFTGRDQDDSNGRAGLYTVDVDDGEVRTIVAPSTLQDLDFPEWSPTGTQIGYTAWDSTVDSYTAAQHVIDADTLTDQVLALDPSATWGAGIWSNDGARMFVGGQPKAGHEGEFFAVVASIGDGDLTVVPLARPAGAATVYGSRWAPDDSVFLATPFDSNGQPLAPMFWDPTSGAVTPASTPVDGSWQRTAP